MAINIALLNGEGDVKTVTSTRRRRECEVCGEPATKRIEYLMENYRRNPTSSAYGRDDCTYCSDATQYSCDEHCREVERPACGYTWAGTRTLSANNHQYFLYWHENAP